jgi:ProP effector
MSSMPQEKPGRKADEIICVLAELFPQTFVAEAWRPHRPLKIGIHADLAGVLTGDELRLAVRHYVNRLMYQRALVAGAARVDLEGNPAETVSPEQAAGAEHLVDGRIKRAEARMLAARQVWKSNHQRRPNKSTEPIPPTPAPTQRPLGLADLKAAALARKAAS